MDNVDDVPVQQLVVDSGAFIKLASLQKLANKIYTIAGVIDELKCDKSRHLLESLPYEIIVQEPSAESLRIMMNFSKKSGDYPSLSAVDLKVLALVHDLHIQAYGADHLDYDCKRSAAAACAAVETVNEECSVDAATDKVNQSGSQKNAVEGENMDVDGDDVSDDGDDDGDDDGVWINEANLDTELRHIGEICVPEKDTKVACITTDFAMQNVLLRLGLNLLTIDGYRIKKLNSYILRCRACFGTTAVMTKKFCSRCGNDALHRVAVTVNEDGTTQLHINWKRLESTRGLKYSLPAPKGGKHAKEPQLFEDQRIPQNRLARCYTNPVEGGPFVLNDVTSRSAILGIKSLRKEARGQNINSLTSGRKRGNKRR